jgi:transcription antitermination factor NusG
MSVLEPVLQPRGTGIGSRSRDLWLPDKAGDDLAADGPQPVVGVATRCGVLDSEKLGPTPGRWWALHTRARNEKLVATALAQRGIPHYLPLVSLQRNYGPRRVTVELPLFPGYLFLLGGADECAAALRTRRVAMVLRIDGQAQFRDELRQIHRVVESGESVDLYPGLQEGRRCRVISGSLAGLEGVVLRRRSSSRMYIAATVLRQSAVIEIDCALLEPLD